VVGLLGLVGAQLEERAVLVRAAADQGEADQQACNAILGNLKMVGKRTNALKVT
jgi:hypothetical protein